MSKIEEIRARHEAGERGSADADREWLLDEVERLTRERDEARAEVEWLRADAERFRWLAGQKRMHLYTDGGTWTRDDGTTFRAWGVLAANGVGYPPAETLTEIVDMARKDQEDGR